MSIPSARPLATTAALLAVLACGPVSDSLGPGMGIEAAVDESGGTLTFLGGILVVDFPPDAVSRQTTFSARLVQNSSPTLVGGYVFDIQPSTNFSVPVTVTVDYSSASMPSGVRETELGIYKLSGNWTEVPGSVVDTANSTVVVAVSSFSTYGLLGAPVDQVVISPGSASVNVGSTTSLSVTVTDAGGFGLPNRSVTWTSLAPQLATVNASGVVTGVSQGSPKIMASSEGVADTVTVTVNDVSTPPPAQVLVSHNFDNQTLGPFWNPWGSAIDFPADPTGSGRGRVARISYSPSSGLSQERAVTYNSPTHLRYGETIWLKGDVYMPSAGSDGTHNRKLIDYQGNGVRMTLHRRGASRDLRLSIVDPMASGVQTETIAESTGLTLADDTWHTIEVRLTTNSADNLRDGILEVYLNGSVTPNYRRDTNLGWITQNYGGGGTYFNIYMVGFQLTIDSGDPAYQEYRYWDNVTYSTARVP